MDLEILLNSGVKIAATCPQTDIDKHMHTHTSTHTATEQGQTEEDRQT